ncbi:hypothetical protein BAY61_10260 [Prauserella marina]|uniref:DUF3291 domain-containing protein n=1 Tax=Prauserella marina TaxID=530584 RepID=A0A222VN57_9PSEU|nr:DUF3291 domain-containing protein [Prauserella marina]ASR35314.1 hypothetical protein BAY61_10260 [Prauserella marina]PWV84903.1 uncharacterized protein DUF3291 [Prauserella marina]SDC09933.1 protein of unknown function [Prauserella marina]
MPTTSWLTPRRPEQDAEAVVLASLLEVKSLRHVPGFLAASLRVWLQVRGSEGAWGVSLRAQPLRRRFWTLSAWRDRESLERFVRTEPHVSIMRRQHDVMREAVFTEWTVPASDLPITWKDATERVERRRKGSRAA